MSLSAPRDKLGLSIEPTLKESAESRPVTAVVYRTCLYHIAAAGAQTRYVWVITLALTTKCLAQITSSV